jgi:hypothetical protein
MLYTLSFLRPRVCDYLVVGVFHAQRGAVQTKDLGTGSRNLLSSGSSWELGLCRDPVAFHELLLPIVWSSVASSPSNRHMRRMKIKKGSAYPVSPVTCVIGIRLTIEVVHFHVAL